MAVELRHSEEQSNTLDVDIASLYVGGLHNVLDKVIAQMILDSKKENDEAFGILKKPLFDPKTPIEQLNVDDSLVLRLAYQKKKNIT